MLIFGIITLLLSTAVNNRRDCSILFSRVSMLILINAAYILYTNTNVNFLVGGIVLYGGLITVKLHTLFFGIFILVLSTFIISLNSFFPRKIIDNNILSYSSNFYKTSYRVGTPEVFNTDINLSKSTLYSTMSGLNTIITNKMSDQYRIIEYPLIILFCLTGAIFLISSSDIISIFLSIELQSYGLYLISSIYRNSESSISAGLTYFLLGGLSSCIILLGMSLLYVNTGNTNLENIYIINNIWNAFSYDIVHNNVLTNNILSVPTLEGGGLESLDYQSIYTEYTYMQLPFAIISVGLLFKIAAAPFHFWSPTVYDSIPTIVTTFVAIIAKISLLVLFLELIFYTDNNLTVLSSQTQWLGSWSNNLIISSILSLIIGSILGLVQHRIKRLYAYSTISHIGFILLALCINTLESTRAFFFYLVQYSISNLNAFIILITIGYSLFIYTSQDTVSFTNNRGNAEGINNNIKENKYSPIEYISQLRGYFYINPMLAISLAVTLFSFIGVPPLIGFFAKQMILSVALDNGYIFATLIGILTSVISAVYYLLLVKLIFFDRPVYIVNTKFVKFLSSYLPFHFLDSDSRNLNKTIIISGFLSFSISLFTLFALLFMFFDQELINIINIISIYT